MPRLRSIVVLTLAVAVGCVERTMQIDTDPPGAIVYLNDQEVGRTPVRRDFLWYGNYDVVVRKEGYDTLKTTKWVVAPIWQWPPIDLIADLLPLRLKDERKVAYMLHPSSTQPAVPEDILARANEMQGLLRSSEYTRSRTPATNPAVP
jgi:hypothetical protein